MSRVLALCCLLPGLAWVGAAGPAQLPTNGPVKGGGPAKAPPPAPPPVVTLAPQSGTPARALAWSLLPDPAEMEARNAAGYWLRAALAARNSRHKWSAKDYEAEGKALKDYPKDQIREILDKHAAALTLCDRAARCTYCDWGRAPLTVQTLGELPLDEIQLNRELARLISMRCRLELAEARFDKAIRSLRTGLALARHVGAGQTMAEDLVGLAISAIMLGRVEEWMQLPGSPNLYWALTELPAPLVPFDRAIRSELNTLHRSIPELRDLEKPKSAAEAQAIAEKCLTVLGQASPGETPDWARKAAAVAMTAKYYPDAKKGLLASGRAAKDVEAMPTIQAVLLWLVVEYDEVRDEVFKWMLVPAWQSGPALDRLARTLTTDARYANNYFIRLLLPAILKGRAASVRSQRQVAGLRAAEALRGYAAAHGGRPPARWEDITAVPGPIDPFTGQGFGAFYRVEAGSGRGTLALPPPPDMPPLLGREYRLDPPAGKGEAR